MNIAVVTLLSLAAINVVLFRAVWTAPRWLVRDLYRLRLGRLSDELYLSTVEGRLPAEHDAVRDLLTRVVTTQKHCDSPMFREMFIIHRLMKHASPELMEDFEKSSHLGKTQGLSEDQKFLLDKYTNQYFLLFAGLVVTGSWLGFLSVTMYIPVGLVRYVLMRRRDRLQMSLESVESAVAASVDEAVARVSKGKLRKYFDKPSETFLAEYEEDLDSEEPILVATG